MTSQKVLGAAFAALLAAGAGAASADTIGTGIGQWQAGAICPSGFAAGGNIPFIAQTQTVPAVVGMGFGVKAQAANPAGYGQVTITVRHPPFTAGGPTAQSFQTSMSGSALSAFYYRFEDASEAQPGTWTVQATVGGTVLYSLDFDVVRPRANDGLLRACGIETSGG